jgi:hypothetical protein
VAYEALLTIVLESVAQSTTTSSSLLLYAWLECVLLEYLTDISKLKHMKDRVQTGTLVYRQHWYSNTGTPSGNFSQLIDNRLQPSAIPSTVLVFQYHTQVLRQSRQRFDILLYQLRSAMMVV